MIPAIVQRLWIFGSMYLPQILVQFFQLTMCSSHFQEFFWILVTVSIVLLISLPKSKKKKVNYIRKILMKLILYLFKGKKLKTCLNEMGFLNKIDIR